MQADIDTLRFAARAFCGFVPAGEMINFAVERLLDGDDSPATVELAALDPLNSRQEDAFPVLCRVLAAGGIHLEDQEAALKAYFRCLVHEIAIGNLDPILGIGRIWEEVIATGLYRAPCAGFHRWYDEGLRDWDLLHGGINPADSSEIPQEQLPGVIRQAAAAWQSREPPN